MIRFIQNFSLKPETVFSKYNRRSFFDPPTRFHKHFPDIFFNLFQKERFDFASRRPDAEKPRRKDFGVIENE